MSAIKNITGQRFGRLLVLSYSHIGNNSRSWWDCLCDCGKTIKANGKILINGDKKSCGCLRIEHIKQLKKPTHGMTKTSIYKLYQGMISRCENPNATDFQNYGGRGITVCHEWRHDFLRFLEDMGTRPRGYSLDRIDNSGVYSKENCRWASPTQQSNNKRTNIILTLNDRSQTIAQWGKELNINPATINRRLNVYKWTTEKALSKDNHSYKDKTISCIHPIKKYTYPRKKRI